MLSALLLLFMCGEKKKKNTEDFHDSRYGTFFQLKSNYIFLISSQKKHRLWYSLEASSHGNHNICLHGEMKNIL